MSNSPQNKAAFMMSVMIWTQMSVLRLWKLVLHPVTIVCALSKYFDTSLKVKIMLSIVYERKHAQVSIR